MFLLSVVSVSFWWLLVVSKEGSSALLQRKYSLGTATVKTTFMLETHGWTGIYWSAICIVGNFVLFSRCRRTIGMHTVWKCRNLKREDHLEDVGLDGRIILKLIFGNTVANWGLDWSGSGCVRVAGYGECGNKNSGC